MAEQTPDVEALARVILPVLPNHCCEPGDVTDCPYDAHDASSIAWAILDSDWLAAREQAAERRGAAKELREAAEEAEAIDGAALTASIAAPSGVPEHGRQECIDAADALLEAPWDWLRARADRIEAES